MECNLKYQNKKRNKFCSLWPQNMATQCWFLSSGLLVEINNGFEVNIARSAAKSGRRERWTSVQALYSKLDKCTNLVQQVQWTGLWEDLRDKIEEASVLGLLFIKKTFPGEERISGFFFSFFPFQKYLQNERKVQVSCCFFCFRFFSFKIHLQEKGEPKYQVSLFLFIFGYLHEGGKTLLKDQASFFLKQYLQEERIS